MSVLDSPNLSNKYSRPPFSKMYISGNDLDTTKVRGTESSIILLSEELFKKGYKVTVVNSIDKPINVNGVEYTNKKVLDLNLWP